jgi:hypothetical protein
MRFFAKHRGNERRIIELKLVDSLFRGMKMNKKYEQMGIKVPEILD